MALTQVQSPLTVPPVAEDAEQSVDLAA
jgi:hypothetical protein